ncbi:MAG: hypothetical protein IT366_24565 [Candidatus Hydrogenedentes bacterium]|nr:hypothetical protein [Candidatus Hydrogenedentota bacterium]
MAERTVKPPAGADAKPDAGSAEEAAKAAIEADAAAIVAGHGIGIDDPEFKPTLVSASPVQMHPKANYFPEGVAPPPGPAKPPKPFQSAYTEEERLQMVLTQARREVLAADKDIEEARREIAMANPAIEAATAAVSAAGDNVEAREKAERSLADARNALERANQKGAKAVNRKQENTLLITGTESLLAEETAKNARQKLRMERWQRGEAPLSREEEDVVLGLVPAAV